MNLGFKLHTTGGAVQASRAIQFTKSDHSQLLVLSIVKEYDRSTSDRIHSDVLSDRIPTTLPVVPRSGRFSTSHNATSYIFPVGREGQQGHPSVPFALTIMGVFSVLSIGALAALAAAARERVTFQSFGTEIVGYHDTPTTQSGPVLAVIIAHGLGGLQTSRLQP